jgi:hypothetical protein
MKVERMIERGRRETRLGIRRGSIESIMSEDDLRSLLRGSEAKSGTDTVTEDDSDGLASGDEFEEAMEKEDLLGKNKATDGK